MGSVKIVMKMSGLMEISNAANEKVAEPIAERVAAAAGDGYRVDSTTRTGIPGWARTRVFTDTVEAMVRERKRGALARALGGAG